MGKADDHPIRKVLKIVTGRKQLVGDKKNVSQLSLDIGREKQADRNFNKGGRSFYFFDFDDNVAFLTTSIYLFHKDSNEEVSVSSGEFARVSHLVGKKGAYQDYNLDFDDKKGSFRNFRDIDIGLLERALGKKQRFVQDVAEALGQKDFQWKGPSWDCFYHAVFNHRPLSVITARGHHPSTIRDGIQAMVDKLHLPHPPNFLNIYPVSHVETRKTLGDHALREPVPELKKRAIHASVEEAFNRYDYNEYHRFGMSDDDPNNVQLITEAMQELKKEFPANSFFVFDSSGHQLVKREIFADHVESVSLDPTRQLSLFDQFDSSKN